MDFNFNYVRCTNSTRLQSLGRGPGQIFTLLLTLHPPRLSEAKMKRLPADEKTPDAFFPT